MQCRSSCARCPAHVSPLRPPCTTPPSARRPAHAGPLPPPRARGVTPSAPPGNRPARMLHATTQRRPDRRRQPPRTSQRPGVAVPTPSPRQTPRVESLRPHRWEIDQRKCCAQRLNAVPHRPPQPLTTPRRVPSYTWPTRLSSDDHRPRTVLHNDDGGRLEERILETAAVVLRSAASAALYAVRSLSHASAGPVSRQVSPARQPASSATRWAGSDRRTWRPALRRGRRSPCSPSPPWRPAPSSSSRTGGCRRSTRGSRCR